MLVDGPLSAGANVHDTKLLEPPWQVVDGGQLVWTKGNNPTGPSWLPTIGFPYDVLRRKWIAGEKTHPAR